MSFYKKLHNGAKHVGVGPSQAEYLQFVQKLRESHAWQLKSQYKHKEVTGSLYIPAGHVFTQKPVKRLPYVPAGHLL